jgi:hypothetical protein
LFLVVSAALNAVEVLNDVTDDGVHLPRLKVARRKIHPDDGATEIERYLLQATMDIQVNLTLITE